MVIDKSAIFLTIKNFFFTQYCRQSLSDIATSIDFVILRSINKKIPDFQAYYYGNNNIMVAISERNFNGPENNRA